MIKLIRKIAGMAIALPFFILLKGLSLFTGKERAVKIIGPIVTNVVTFMAEVALIPKIHQPMEYDSFVMKMKKNLFNLRLLYDVSVKYEDKDTIVFNYSNCPHCEAFYSLGIPELGPYSCDSDWEIARKNTGIWAFERSCQIGTGDRFCNHSYTRIKV